MEASDQKDSAVRSVLLRWSARLANLVWVSVMLVLVVIALYVVIGRQLMGSVSDYQAELEARLSERLGQPVRVDSLQGQWKGLDPVLSLHGLAAKDPESPDTDAARVDHINIRLDTVTSLVRGRLVFSDLVASGLDLSLEQTADGAISVDGIPLAHSALMNATSGSEQSGGPSDWINRLGEILSDPSVQLNQVRLGLQVPGEELRTFFIPQVDLRYDQGIFSASGRAMQPGSTTQLASFSLKGRHFFRGDFDGRLFVDIDSGHLFDTLIQRYAWQQRTVESFDAGGQAWLHFSDGQLQTVNADLSVPHLQFRADGDTRAPIESARARVGWQRLKAGGWKLAVRDLGWSWSGETVNGINLELVHADDWEARANTLPVGLLSRMALAIAPLDDSIRNPLAHYSPEGALKRARFHTEAGQTFSLDAQLNDASVAAYDGAPGASGINGSLAMTESAGQVTIDSGHVALGFPELFLNTWQLDTLSTQVNWAIEGKTKRVWSDQIDVQYRGDTRMAGAFELTLNDPGDDTLSMRVDSWNATAPMIADFVPAKIVDPELYDWLTTAVEQAAIERGTFYGHGQVNDGAPPDSFTAGMRFQFSDARLKYDPAWPVVTDANGTVEVQGTQAHIALTSGRTGGLALEPTSVTVDGAAEPTRLKVKTAADFKGSDFHDWLSISPLGTFAGDAAIQLRVQGDYHLDLGLDLALEDDAEPVVDATLVARDARIAYSDTEAVWEQVNGTVRYHSDKGFSGEALTARFLGSPVELSLSRNGNGAPLTLTQTGRMDVHALAKRLDVEAPPGIDGRASYTARLGLSASGASTLALSSSLSNISIDWPFPLGKEMGKPTPFETIVSWGEGGGMLVSGHWEDRLAYRLRWKSREFERGRIEFGANSTSLSGEAGLDVTGHLDRLDLSVWGDALKKHGLPSAGSSGASAGIDWLHHVALNLGETVFAGQTFKNTNVIAQPGDAGWALVLDGPDIAGRLRLPAGDDPLTIDLDKVVLNTGEQSESAEDAPSSAVPFGEQGVADWPDADVTIGNLTFNDRDYGAWSFLFRPAARALKVDKISGQVGSLAFDGNLIWSADSGDEQTQVNGVLAGENLADIAPWIDGSVPLRSKKTRVEVDLGWVGPPENAALETLTGTLGFRLDDGVILERSNTAQIFRVFGVLNSDTLLRRLKLDFSDLYEAGVAFDAISGTARLASGTLSWEPELQIVGPSGAFKLTGTTDLIEESLDMRLVVVLPLTQNLPLAAILMGAAPPIGGALFVLDKVLGDPLSRLTSATYSVTGSWDDPRVDLRNVFDTGS